VIFGKNILAMGVRSLLPLVDLSYFETRVRFRMIGTWNQLEAGEHPWRFHVGVEVPYCFTTTCFRRYNEKETNINNSAEKNILDSWKKSTCWSQIPRHAFM